MRSRTAAELPDVGFHVVAGDHPERIVVDEHARGVARLPGSVSQFTPGYAVGRIPDVVAIARRVVVALENPQMIVPDGDFVILAWMPGS